MASLGREWKENDYNSRGTFASFALRALAARKSLNWFLSLYKHNARTASGMKMRLEM